GILNCTPDSFSDGGQWFDTDVAVEHALQMEADGADIIDIGGESTRPGSDAVSAEEEMNRVLPVIEKLQGKLKVPISIDSYKAETAEAALKAGAHIINDVWGFQYDNGEMAAVAAKYDCPMILMHNKTEAVYDNFMAEMTSFLRRSMDIAVNAGCDRNKIILDPGFGFGKEMQHNLLLTNKLKELTSLGCPVLMAASRKKTVGLVLDVPADQRLMGDAAVTAIAVANGADMIRVHDVKEMAQVAKMADAIVREVY
ncbi:MAG: dihydropteroate synthase, partial [Firmicutes bacterium]|nr:dihydropteroate synthase [Bacillota bacterium]